jgi:hypothetical protein
MINEQGGVGLLLDRAGDALPVLRSEQECPQDQQIKRALQEGDAGVLVLLGRHATGVSLLLG